MSSNSSGSSRRDKFGIPIEKGGKDHKITINEDVEIIIVDRPEKKI
jgi:hypothetical protein